MDYGVVAAIITALGGLLVGIHRLVKYLMDWVANQQSRHEAFMAEQHKEWQTFIGNHMSANTRTLEALVSATEAMAENCQGEEE